MSELLVENKVNNFTVGLSETHLSFPKNILDFAKEVISGTDFPTTRNERWKYTRLTKITNKTFVSKQATVNALDLPIKEAFTIVFVNGYYNESLSSIDDLPKGLIISPLSKASDEHLGQIANQEQSIFTSINTLHSTDGAYVHLKEKTALQKPIQIVHVVTGEKVIANTRNLIVADAFSKAEITQVFISDNAKESFVNNVTEVFVENNAHLTLNKFQNESEENYHISSEFVKQTQNSNFKINTITLNGGLVRNDLWIDVTGKNAETHLNGAYILKGSQHIDNHTTVDHLIENCESNELYKGVIDEKATAVFNGKVYVRKNAQKINAYQSNANVLLTDTASVNSKPELEIYADDVKCSHGSTTGQLDEDAIYYLRARGISEKSAKALMVTAFIGDVIEKLDSEEAIKYTHQELHKRFGWDF